MSLEVAAAQISGRKKLGKKKSFSKLKDDATGNFYYHDVETDEVVWYVLKKMRQLGETFS